MQELGLFEFPQCVFVSLEVQLREDILTAHTFNHYLRHGHRTLSLDPSVQALSSRLVNTSSEGGVGQSQCRRRGLGASQSQGRRCGLGGGQSQGRRRGLGAGQSNGKRRGLGAGQSQGKRRDLCVGQSQGKRCEAQNCIHVKLADSNPIKQRDILRAVHVFKLEFFLSCHSLEELKFFTDL